VFGKTTLFKKDVGRISVMPLFINYFLMVFGVIISNFWTIMSIPQKFLPKRQMRITFSKRAFRAQTAIQKNCLPNIY